MTLTCTTTHFSPYFHPFVSPSFSKSVSQSNNPYVYLSLSFSQLILVSITRQFPFYSCDVYHFVFILLFAALYDEFISAIFISVFQETDDGCPSVCWHSIWQWNCKSSQGCLVIITIIFIIIIIIESHSFPWAMLSENCSLLGTDNVDRKNIQDKILQWWKNEKQM